MGQKLRGDDPALRGALHDPLVGGPEIEVAGRDPLGQSGEDGIVKAAPPREVHVAALLRFALGHVLLSEPVTGPAVFGAGLIVAGAFAGLLADRQVA